MGRIRVLSDTVANQIAAGEVVERPASVVKELLENSLDAGSSSIRVEIENGGRRLIKITDNGCGMLQDDALLAFERHATSKLSSAKDLLSISTLGFRGEALPSIASVSRLLLETRSADESTGNSVEIAGGKILNVGELAASPGTVITVRDLFFNVPARKKFLRSEQTELAHIASLVTHYSLAHPDKTFELRNGSAELLHVTPVSTLDERVFQVFGKELLEEHDKLRSELLKRPRWSVTRDGGGFRLMNAAESTTALAVTLDVEDHRKFVFTSSAQWTDMNGQASEAFAGRAQAGGAYEGITFEVSWTDQGEERHTDKVFLESWDSGI